MKVPPTQRNSLSKVLENNLVHLDWDSGIVASKAVLHNHSDITVFEKIDQIRGLFFFPPPMGYKKKDKLT